MKCEQPCEVYSRVVGYLRPVQYWNLGKQEEWKERVPYNPQIIPKPIIPKLPEITKSI